MEVKNFWFQINKWLSLEHSTYISLTMKDILFGEIEGIDIQKRVVLYAKLFIFHCKYENILPRCDSFLLWVSKHMDL